MQNAKPSAKAVDENFEMASGERCLEAAQNSGGTADTRTAQNPGAVGAFAVGSGGERGRSGPGKGGAHNPDADGSRKPGKGSKTTAESGWRGRDRNTSKPDERRDEGGRGKSDPVTGESGGEAKLDKSETREISSGQGFMNDKGRYHS